MKVYTAQTTIKESKFLTIHTAKESLEPLTNQTSLSFINFQQKRDSITITVACFKKEALHTILFKIGELVGYARRSGEYMEKEDAT